MSEVGGGRSPRLKKTCFSSKNLSLESSLSLSISSFQVRCRTNVIETRDATRSFCPFFFFFFFPSWLF